MRRALVFPVATVFWLMFPGMTSAHAVVVASDPAGVCLSVAASVPLPGDSRCIISGTENVPLAQPPAAVRVWFSEPVEPFGDGLSVIGPDGHRVDRGPLRLSPTAEGIDVDATQVGTYVVHWQIVAADTHPARGSFRFVVGHPGGVLASIGAEANRSEAGVVAPEGFVLAVAARWLHFLGYALSFGVLAIRVVVFKLPGSSRGALSDQLWILVNLGLVLLVLAEPVSLLGQTGSLGEASLFDPDVVSAALDSSFGRILALRLGAPFLLWLLVGIAREGSQRVEFPAFALGIGLATLDGFSAHASGVQPIWVGLTVNACHLMGMAIWLGGLIALVVTWPILRADSVHAEQSHIFQRMIRVAGGSVVLLAASGSLLAGAHLSGPGDLVNTSYGAVITVKASLFAAILILVGLGRRWRWFPGRRGWIIEAVGLFGILVLAGVLTSLPPPS